MAKKKVKSSESSALEESEAFLVDAEMVIREIEKEEIKAEASDFENHPKFNKFRGDK